MNEALRIQQEIKKYEGELVTKAEDLIDREISFKGQSLRIYQKIKDGNRSKEILEEKQMRNVLNVALEANCVEVVENFVKYQIGRSGQNDKWKFGGFGDALIDKVRQDGFIYKIANDRVVGNLRQKDRKGKYDLNQIWLKLVRLYLGYLNRYFYYRKKEQDKADNPQG